MTTVVTMKLVTTKRERTLNSSSNPEILRDTWTLPSTEVEVTVVINPPPTETFIPITVFLLVLICMEHVMAMHHQLTTFKILLSTWMWIWYQKRTTLWALLWPEERVMVLCLPSEFGLCQERVGLNLFFTKTLSLYKRASFDCEWTRRRWLLTNILTSLIKNLTYSLFLLIMKLITIFLNYKHVILTSILS